MHHEGVVTIYQVARLAGVSTATVSRTVNGTGQVSRQTRERVQTAVRSLGYRPNAVARSLVKRATHTLALILPDIGNPFFPALVRGVQLLANERGYSLLLCNSEGDADKERRYIDRLRADHVDGLLVAGLAMRRDRLSRAGLAGLPIVSLDRNLDLPGAPVVKVDHRKAAQLITDHLIGLGHQRIGHITGPAGLGVTGERLAGYREALTEAGIPFQAQLLAGGDFTAEAGYQGIEVLFLVQPPPTAVFAANDLMAMGAIAALHDRGLRVPDQVSVAGFDDIQLAAYCAPALTTVRQPTYEMGRRAAELLIDWIRHGQEPHRQGKRILFDGDLVIRASTAPAPRPATLP